MKRGQKSVKNNIEDFLCPFTDMYISQGSNGAYSHKGIMANDVRGLQAGIRYPYYAPCKIKCLAVYKNSGQSMWQSINKVRFANGRIDYATFMIAHDDTQDCYVGQVVEQGSQLGNMGTKGNATGVHCHIQISQSKDTKWYKNKYGVYQFSNEYDLDDCYFVDNTSILKGMGGNWRTTTAVKVEETVPQNKADQILHKGSKVKFDGIFKIDILKSPVSSNLFGCCQLTGCSFNDYKNEKVKKYHWIPANDFTEVDKNGNSTKDQVLTGGSSYVLNKNIYEVLEIDIPTNSAKLNLNGHDVWIYSTYLYEVSNS